MRNALIFGIGIIVLVILYNLFTFAVDETQTAVVKRFGEVVRVTTEPGLNFRLPFVDQIIFLEDRLLNYDIQPKEIITADQRRLRIDNYALWRIEDPKLFVEKLRGDLRLAQSRLDDVVFSNIRDVLARHTLADIISVQRLEFLALVTDLTDNQVHDFGMAVIDVQVKRADLPREVEQDVYARMRSEREQAAAQLRAEGDEQGLQIRSKADADRAKILAEANRRAEERRGEADAQALVTYANAYSQNPEFYQFWRSLESYKRSFADGTTVVISTDADYLRFFDSNQLVPLEPTEAARE
ncbi:MAG: protease modulator HflC [Candidatus Bipolaricaulia bacterium]